MNINNMSIRKYFILITIFIGLFFYCSKKSEEVSQPEPIEKSEMETSETDSVPKYYKDRLEKFMNSTKIEADIISYEPFAKGKGPIDFEKHSGSKYKPSYNHDPAIPVQCWIETSYGSQNACKYCHTNFLTQQKHGNNFPIGEDQILFSFPSPNLNKINWRNVTHPQEVVKRLEAEGKPIPKAEDLENLSYIRTNNWDNTYRTARPDGNTTWDNMTQSGNEFQLFPALNPRHLFPSKTENPTDDNQHGYVDNEGFVKNEWDQYTGWRAVNFFPYAIFKPLTGSVSGIYIRLPKIFMQDQGKDSIEIYRENLDLLEKNIKMESFPKTFYQGDAQKIPIQKGFYPVGTEFAHPLHYVDLNADGEMGKSLNGLNNKEQLDYEFPGTRSKRVKEIRYMYKWQKVQLNDISQKEIEEEFPKVIGKEWQGWIDNKAGWILAAYIENKEGQLRPQTTEELLQCLGCHSSVGNTIDSVWSFQRKLPGTLGWQEMNYGDYKKNQAEKTHLNDYQNETIDMGELEYFYYSVVGADLFGIMPQEIKTELFAYAKANNLKKELQLKSPLDLIFDDEKLENTPKKQRKKVLVERAKIMRHYAHSHTYLFRDEKSSEYFIKGTLFYPNEVTMKANIAGYRRIVLDQSFNLGKNVFGSQPEEIPFTFRSDGTVRDAENKIIPVGNVINSRPWDSDGVGNTPTGLVKVNDKGEPIDANGNVVDVEKEPEKAVGHITTGGTFDTMYNPIIKKKLKIGNKT